MRKILLGLTAVFAVGFVLGTMILTARAFVPQNRTVPMTNTGDAVVAASGQGIFYLATSSSHTFATSTFPLYATTTTSVHGAQYYNDGDDQNVVFITFAASSTGSILDWQYQFSNDESTWFNQDIVATSILSGENSVAHASTTVVHSWKPGTVSTTSKAVELPDIPARYKRVVFYPDPQAGSNGGALIVTGVNKRYVVNQ